MFYTAYRRISGRWVYLKTGQFSSLAESGLIAEHNATFMPAQISMQDSDYNVLSYQYL